MMKLRLLFGLVLFGSTAFSSIAASQEVLFFFEQGCPHCARIDRYLEERIRPHYSVEIRKLEIHDSSHALLMYRMARFFHAQEVLEKGTPAVFIGEAGIQGTGRLVERRIEQAVRRVIGNKIPSSLSLLEQGTPQESLPKVTIPVLLGAAVADAFNPCAFAILILLLGTMGVRSGKKSSDVIKAGLAFSASCYLSYFFMGIGIYSAVRVARVTRSVIIFVAGLAILLGLWNIKDAFWYGKGLPLEVPRSWQRRMRRLVSGVRSVPGAFFVGIGVSLFLLPCTSGPYLIIIGMLARTATRVQAMLLLLFYNAVFILPFVVITLAVGLGASSSERIEKWRTLHLNHMNLAAGLLLFLLGLFMIAQILLGNI